MFSCPVILLCLTSLTCELLGDAPCVEVVPLRHVLVCVYVSVFSVTHVMTRLCFVFQCHVRTVLVKVTVAFAYDTQCRMDDDPDRAHVRLVYGIL